MGKCGKEARKCGIEARESMGLRLQKAGLGMRVGKTWDRGLGIRLIALAYSMILVTIGSPFRYDRCTCSDRAQVGQRSESV